MTCIHYNLTQRDSENFEGKKRKSRFFRNRLCAFVFSVVLCFKKYKYLSLHIITPFLFVTIVCSHMDVVHRALIELPRLLFDLILVLLHVVLVHL